MFKRKPISGEASPKDELDTIDYKVYEILVYVKYALIALIIYLFVLTVTEGYYVLESAKSEAVGTIIKKEYLNQKPYKEVNYEIGNGSFIAHRYN